MSKLPATDSTSAPRRTWARRSAFVAAGAAMVLGVSGTLSTASAQQQTYWGFLNVATDRCLSGAPSGNVWAGNCDSVVELHQQWDFLSNSGEQSRIRNRETGTCLTTGSSSGPDPVWLAPCDEPNQQWHYTQSTGTIQSMATGHFLRTSPANDDVYATTDNPDIPLQYYQWAGAHT
ncbi:RICIN domain-containing protein [Streptomyces litchfieldiae]|uniref:RICIN domain-containing protein n=1 Tax=Streptomyces litchfieldiae TaxID=3075543 RepID=A0ABU2MVE6_9ACTN|nr:RICIN domain-containing protein [Streptomyces sp. DSM 44938]MDT0345490.1 RICIN domain-containing protein [Streptomyces sp. DSM 44938]